MKKLALTFCLMISVLLGSVGMSSALPVCKGSPKTISKLEEVKSWSNCDGSITAPNGNKYVGEFKDGKRNGQGTYTWADGRKYVGEFKDEKRHGQGTFTFPDGGKYVGESKDD